MPSDTLQQSGDRQDARDRHPTARRGAAARSAAAGALRSSRDLVSARGALLLLTLLLCAAPLAVIPMPGFYKLDDGWRGILNLVRPLGLQAGRSFDFTYGPWGFVDAPLAISRIELAASIAFALVALAFTWGALRVVLRRAMPDTAAAAVASVLLILCTPATGGASISAVFVIGVPLLLLDQVGFFVAPERGRPWVIPVSAMIAAVVLQVKFSEGILLIALVVVACAFAPARRLRSAAWAVGVFVVSTVVAWVVVGQSLGTFVSWVSASIQISRYYGDAMALSTGSGFDLAMMLLVAAAVLVLAVRVCVARGGRRGAAVVVMSVLVEYLAFREATTRFDVSHTPAFFVYSLGVVVWLAAATVSPGPAGAGRRRHGAALLRAVAGAACVLAVLGAENAAVYANLHVVAHRWAVSVRATAQPGYRASLLAAARVQGRLSYAVPPGMLATIGHHPLSADGTVALLPWTYKKHMIAEPLVQSYNAYSTDLDRIAAHRLATLPGDAYVLRPSPTAIDGRNDLWDPPRYVRTEMCMTTAVSHTRTRWLLLRKGADRCAHATQVSSTHVAAHTSLAVPSAGPDQMVTMSFRPDSPGLLERLRRLVDKPDAPLMVSTGRQEWRLPRSLAVGPLVMVVPSTVGWPAQFGGGTRYRTVSFSEGGTVRFSVATVRPAGAAG